METVTVEICVVCEEHLAEPNVAQCLNCFRSFHLQMRMDVAGKDCGQVWLHEEHLYLVFGCRVCLEADLFEERERGRNV
jgi:hypothetical protein